VQAFVKVVTHFGCQQKGLPLGSPFVLVSLASVRESRNPGDGPA
jgi:hypothetical protein